MFDLLTKIPNSLLHHPLSVIDRWSNTICLISNMKDNMDIGAYKMETQGFVLNIELLKALVKIYEMLVSFKKLGTGDRLLMKELNAIDKMTIVTPVDVG